MYLHPKAVKGCKRLRVALGEVENSLTRILVLNEICRGNGGENERDTPLCGYEGALAAVGYSTKEGLSR